MRPFSPGWWLALRAPGLKKGLKRSISWVLVAQLSRDISSDYLQPRRCITGDTLSYMDQVSIRELRNKGGEVLERVARGERLVVTRDGHAVAELRPFGRLALSASLLTERWSKLPKVDPERLRSDIDGAIDSRL